MRIKEVLFCIAFDSFCKGPSAQIRSTENTADPEMDGTINKWQMDRPTNVVIPSI
jgi:hypothetical protein